MAVLANPISIHRYIGLSTDTKPTIADPLGLPPPTVSSTFLEYDTDLMFITYDGTNWVEKSQVVKVSSPFGEPTLIASLNSDAVWSRGSVSPLFQKSTTGWLANLYGGVQSGDDFAALCIPADEMKLPNLVSALWTYYMTAAESFGVNMVIWAHDPDDPSKRVEITQLANVAGLAKASGWNKHILNRATAQFFYSGEGTTGTALSAGSGNLYSLAQFQADVLFSTWRIYRISFEYGWQASGTFDDAWLAGIKLNGIVIPLKPDSGGSGRIGHRYVEHANDVVALTLAPKTPFRLLSIDVHLSAALADTELVTITKDSGYGTDTYHDTVILSENLYTGTRLSYHGAFGEGYEFGAPDELDIALSANSLNRNIGISVGYQTVF